MYYLHSYPYRFGTGGAKEDAFLRSVHGAKVTLDAGPVALGQMRAVCCNKRAHDGFSVRWLGPAEKERRGERCGLRRLAMRNM